MLKVGTKDKGDCRKDGGMRYHEDTENAGGVQQTKIGKLEFRSAQLTTTDKYAVFCTHPIPGEVLISVRFHGISHGVSCAQIVYDKRAFFQSTFFLENENVVFAG